MTRGQDPTADIAVGLAAREERMAWIERRTGRHSAAGEEATRREAARMRRMTDGQLVRYVEDRTENARSEGYERGREKGRREAAPPPDVDGIMAGIAAIRGVGETKLGLIRRVLEERLGVRDA